MAPPTSLRREARKRVRAACTHDRRRRWADRSAAAGRLALSSWGVLLPLGAGVAVLLAWPLAWTPHQLRDAERATGFLESLWQVEAAAVALSAAIVTFSFATFSSSRIAQLGASLPRYARDSGLLVGVLIGLTGILACGAVLLCMPHPAPRDGLLSERLAAAAVAATTLCAVGLLVIPWMLRRALHAGDRGWLQGQLLRGAKQALNAEVVRSAERACADELLRRTSACAGVKLGLGPPAPGDTGRSSVVRDVNLRRLGELVEMYGRAGHEVVLSYSLRLGQVVAASDPLVYLPPGARMGQALARRVARLDGAPDTDLLETTDLELLQRQALAAVQDDDPLWYRQIAGYYGELLLHLHDEWRAYALVSESVRRDGLDRLATDVEAQGTKLIELGRRELARELIDRALAVGLRTINDGDANGVARRMLDVLEDLVRRAGERPSDAAATDIGADAGAGIFMLVREAGAKL